MVTRCVCIYIYNVQGRLFVIYESTIDVYYIIFYTVNAIILRNGSSHIIYFFHSYIIIRRRRGPDSLAIILYS